MSIAPSPQSPLRTHLPPLPPPLPPAQQQQSAALNHSRKASAAPPSMNRSRPAGRAGPIHKCHYPGCGKEFNRRWNLHCHSRIHCADDDASSRPYHCTHAHCTRSFRWKSSLNHHLMSLDHATPAERLARKSGVKKKKNTSSIWNGNNSASSVSAIAAVKAQVSLQQQARYQQHQALQHQQGVQYQQPHAPQPAPYGTPFQSPLAPLPHQYGNQQQQQQETSPQIQKQSPRTHCQPASCDDTAQHQILSHPPLPHHSLMAAKLPSANYSCTSSLEAGTSANSALLSLPSPTSSISGSPMTSPKDAIKTDSTAVTILPADALHEALSSILEAPPTESLSTPGTPSPQNAKPEPELFPSLANFGVEENSTSPAFTDIFGADVGPSPATIDAESAQRQQKQEHLLQSELSEQQRQHGSQASQNPMECGVNVDLDMLSAAIDDATESANFPIIF